MTVKMKNAIKTARFTTFVHTVQLSSIGWSLDEDTAASLPYIIQYPILRKGRMRFVVNPNKYNGKCSTVDETIAAIDAITHQLGIEDCECRVDRVDVAVDTFMDYDSLWKPMNYLKELCGLEWGNNSNSYRVIGDDMKKRSTVLRTDAHILEIYNKQLESGDKAAPSARCEFRFTRVWRGLHRQSVRGAILWAVSETIGILNNLPNHIQEHNAIQSKRLLETYRIEHAANREGRIRSLRDFAARYNDCIYTRPPLQALFEHTQHIKLDKWLYDYRKSGGILTFVNKTDIVLLCTKMNASIREYACNKEYFAKNKRKKVAA